MSGPYDFFDTRHFELLVRIGAITEGSGAKKPEEMSPFEREAMLVKANRNLIARLDKKETDSCLLETVYTDHHCV